MMSGFSMYFWTTQCLPLLSFMYFKISLYFYKTMMPRPLLACPGFTIHRFLFPFISNWGNCSFSFARTFFVKSKSSGYCVFISILFSLFFIFVLSLKSSLYWLLRILNHSLSFISCILAGVSCFLVNSSIFHSVSEHSSPLHSSNWLICSSIVNSRFSQILSDTNIFGIVCSQLFNSWAAFAT